MATTELQTAGEALTVRRLENSASVMERTEARISPLVNPITICSSDGSELSTASADGSSRLVSLAACSKGNAAKRAPCMLSFHARKPFKQSTVMKSPYRSSQLPNQPWQVQFRETLYILHCDLNCALPWVAALAVQFKFSL